jgi:hypothetical protein
VSIVLRPVVPTSDGCRSKFEGQTLQSAPQTGLFPKVNKNTLQSHKPAGSPRHLFTPSFRGIGFDVELASIGGGSSKRHSSTNGKSCFTKSLKNEIKKRKLATQLHSGGRTGKWGGSHIVELSIYHGDTSCHYAEELLPDDSGDIFGTFGASWVFSPSRHTVK